MFGKYNPFTNILAETIKLISKKTIKEEEELSDDQIKLNIFREWKRENLQDLYKEYAKENYDDFFKFCEAEFKEFMGENND